MPCDGLERGGRRIEGIELALGHVEPPAVQPERAGLDLLGDPAEAHQVQQAVEHGGLLDGARDLLARPACKLAHGQIAHLLGDGWSRSRDSRSRHRRCRGRRPARRCRRTAHGPAPPRARRPGRARRTRWPTRCRDGACRAGYCAGGTMAATLRTVKMSPGLGLRQNARIDAGIGAGRRSGSWATGLSVASFSNRSRCSR